MYALFSYMYYFPLIATFILSFQMTRDYIEVRYILKSKIDNEEKKDL